jgi:transcriptional regulator with XRE-family HTH domain
MDKFEWADWIKAEREKKGLSVLDLAKAIGVQRVTIYNYEDHKRTKPDPDILKKISVALGYPAYYLLEIAGIIPKISRNTDDHNYQDEVFKPLTNDDILTIAKSVNPPLTNEQLASLIGNLFLLQNDNKK